MKHYSEGDLTLYYYGEGRGWTDVEKHLGDCAVCAALYRDISGTLTVLTEPEVPDRGDQYGLEVWQRIRHQLPEPGGSWWSIWLRWDRLAMAGAAAVLVMAAFVAGRVWSSTTSAPAPALAPSTKVAAATDDVMRDRILMASVADHLERSERMLTDIMNAPDRADISTEQAWADDLLQASRLYRQDAIDAGEQSAAAMLDELERNLLEIVHSPSKISAADLEQMRRRMDAAALLFKVRVMSDELRQRDTPADPAGPQTSTRKVS